jgi:hypothetical protein
MYTADQMMLIPNSGVCANCNGIYSLGIKCSCMATDSSKPQGEGGDHHREEYWFICPSCGITVTGVLHP